MGIVTPFPLGREPGQVGFERVELNRILDLYGRMVAAGHWKDYAMELGKDAAVFAAFRRTAERPEFRIEKRPALRGERRAQFDGAGAAEQRVERGQHIGEARHQERTPVDRQRDGGEADVERQHHHGHPCADIAPEHAQHLEDRMCDHRCSGEV
ncbi:hypothetical protein WR25_13081 [Diploscapter pachys]|uniref:DUF2794 domain-containing protein n=1 Tax=Diploscapter pachys TaxID=2018661 RepID=A0A2A2KHR9_9BILA|nr:hypothetical protein WR25_13081 [Diploscapter pachys]